jgi:excisionase family DNA binding protein
MVRVNGRRYSEASDHHTRQEADVDTERREPWVKTREVAEHLGLPETTLHQWRHRGTGPRAHRVGRHLLWKLSEVDAWVEEQQSDPIPAA